jgi:TonB family protein
MKRTLATLLLLLAAPAVLADEADIVKGLRNLAQMHQIAAVLELENNLEGTLPLKLPPDVWGHELYLEGGRGGYRLISAGSNGILDKATWGDYAQFTGTEGDVVIDRGKVLRSNRNWLVSQIGTSAAAADALAELLRAEIEFAKSRTPLLQSVTGAQATAMLIQQVGRYIENNHTPPAAEVSRDAWGTPLRVTIEPSGDYQVVSAGEDKQFAEASWSQKPAPSFAEDIVYRNGAFVRQVSAADVAAATPGSRVPPTPQPPDPSYGAPGSNWLRVAEGVTAPVVIERVEPVYPEDYRKARVAGIVVLEMAITATGQVEHVSVLKSLAPGLDDAAVTAVRKWKFKPATKDGQPVPVLNVMTINFQLR